MTKRPQMNMVGASIELDESRPESSIEPSGLVYQSFPNAQTIQLNN